MKLVGVVGASGRTGSIVTSLLAMSPGPGLGAAIVSEGSSSLGRIVPGSEISYSGDLKALEGCGGVIDFSTAEVSPRVAKECARLGVPLLVAATGHSQEQLSVIHACAATVPVCVAGNTSVGATALGMVAEYARSILGESFDVEVMEVHHRMKRDAPSGTAKSITQGLVADPSAIVCGRGGPRKSGEVGVVSVRGGDVVGDHTVFFLGEGERLEITHRAQSREIFARGAVTLIQRLSRKPPGLYSVRELLLNESL